MTTPRIYVGTYAKYNSGSLEGKWFDLEDYSDSAAFEAACQDFHGPGEHEFMFQDHEGIPSRFISESSLDDDVWDQWVSLDEDDKVLLQTYLEHIDSNGDLEAAQESFQGKFESAEDWAAEYWADAGMLKDIPEGLQGYIDYAAYARDCELGGDITVVENGYRDVWIFNRNV